MFGDKTGNIFWEMIKNQKKNNTKPSLISSKAKRYSVFLENQYINSGLNGDLMEIISKLPTYKKICLLQGLLKEMKSIKERLEDNIDNLLKNISQNCFYYYKSKIEMKEIYDYCQCENHEINLNYTLCENTKEKLSKDYKILYDVLFLLREDYNIMLLIIKNCSDSCYEALADFLVNFFYENTVNSSFNEEELMILIYLLLEELILVKMPKSFISLYSKNEGFFGKDFLNYIFKYITRKVDVRNYTCMILSSKIIKLEESNIDLSISLQKINSNDHSQNSSKKSSIVKKKNTDEQVLHINSLDSDFVQLESPNFKMNKTLSPVISDLAKVDELQEKYFGDNPEKIGNYFFQEVNQFFYDNDVTLEFLNSKLAEYENKDEQDTITVAMRDYIDLQISQISLENSEIFSNSIYIIDLKNCISENEKENSDKMMNLIEDNYIKITKFIDEILEEFKSNITSMPYLIKSIGFILEILLNKKYNKNGKSSKSNDYMKLMILSNYFLEKIILPLIENPDFNGIITTMVISKITRENLQIIHKVLSTMLSGKLFSNKKDHEYTLFNKYIIITIPKIFNIILSINQQKNFKLPNKIQKLLSSCDIENKEGKYIEYDYFKENQESIRQESICFSLENLNMLINSIRSCIDLFTNEKYFQYFKLFENFIKLSFDLCRQNINNIRKEDYFLVEKIEYSPNFKKLINNVLQDNIFALMPNTQNDELSIFKNCLVDLLSYVNILNKENFNHFMQSPQKISIPFEQSIKKNYSKILFDDDNELTIENNNSSDMFLLKDFYEEKEMEEEEEDDDDKDADFKEVIFPQIIDIVKRELSNNIDTEKSKRIVFCSSYLQAHLSDLPVKYTENNYKLLLMELIQKSEEIVKELNVSILNNFYSKVKDGDKLNMIISSNLFQIKKIEKWVCIEYLFEKITLPCKIVLIKDNTTLISKVEYTQIDPKSSYIHSIQSFIKTFPNFRKYENFKEVNDIIELEEKVEVDVALNSYFKDLKGLIKKEEIIKRFTKEEQQMITQELENYILFKLYDKLFPKNSSKSDLKFYNKCCRLDFIKPENLIKDKNMINENLWKTSMVLINEMDNKLTPADKMKSFEKAFGILQNSITFSSGKNDLGIDDTVSFLIYIILKSKPKNICSNSKYCQLLLNPDLAKRQYGILLTQLEMVKNIIFDMKYTDLIGVTEEEFGKDED